MKSESKQKLIAAAAVAVIAGSCAWIYFTQFNAAKFNVGLHKQVGVTLAEQTANLIGKKGRVVSIAIDPKDWPELKTQLAAFKTRLHQLGEFDLREYEMDTKDQPKYGVGSGLSGRRYIRTVKKNEKADVFVSFIGAPTLTDEEIAELGTKPKLIVEDRSPYDLHRLFTNELLHVAVVSRFEFPAPSVEKPKTPQQWFTKRFQIVTPQTMSSLPKP